MPPQGYINLFDLGIDTLAERDSVPHMWISHQGAHAYQYWTNLYLGSYAVPFDQLSIGMTITVGIKKADKKWRFDLVDFDKAGLLFLPAQFKPDAKMMSTGEQSPF